MFINKLLFWVVRLSCMCCEIDGWVLMGACIVASIVFGVVLDDVGGDEDDRYICIYIYM